MNKDHVLVEARNRDKAPFENYLMIDYGHSCSCHELSENEPLEDVIHYVALACPAYEVESCPSGLGQYYAAIKLNGAAPNDVGVHDSTDFNAFPRR